MKAIAAMRCMGKAGEPFASEGTRKIYCTTCGQETELGPAPKSKPRFNARDARAVRVPPPKKRRA
jgi:hypothetical protein